MDHVAAAHASTGERILVVEDDPVLVRTTRMVLEDSGYRVTSAQSGAEAQARLERDVFDLCFLDLGLGDGSGLELLQHVRSVAPWMRVVIVTGNADIDTAIAALRAGASDYLLKPCSAEQLRHAAAKQIEARRLESRLAELERSVAPSLEADLRSASHAYMRVLSTAQQVADTGASVLILGESGTGKGVIARAIHGWSSRRAANFVTVSCPALSPALVESELFGHRKGAFTGAVENAVGRAVHADGGTLFLDEIGDFPLVLQPKLLRFIQDREFERVGDPVTQRADVRIVAATNRSLAGMAAEGTFREDLLFRLNVITLEVPPLRQRPEDVVGLAERFLAHFAATYRRDATSFSPAAVDAMRRYRWPGNVRELRNVVERAAILCTGPVVQRDDLVLDASQPDAASGLRVGDDATLEQLERAHIAAVLETNPVFEQTAATLGIDVSTLYRKRREYGL